MKCLPLLLITLLSMATHAQDCSISPLFKQGTVLEYRSYWALNPINRSKFTEMTRLTFTVSAVKDSNNVKYSYITKTGVSPLNDRQRYEKQYIITCDGNSISIPWDFYTPGTIYFSNRYPNNKPAEKDTGVHNVITYSQQGLMEFPASSNNTGFKIKESHLLGNIFTRGYSTTYGRNMVEVATSKREFETSVDAEITQVKDIESKSITIPAGSFNCMVAYVLLDPGSKRQREIGYKFYYTPAAGVAKVEGLYSNFKHIAEYVELVSIK